MIEFLLIIIHVGGLMAQTYAGPSTTPAIDMSTKPVMCTYRHNFSDSPVPNVGIDCFPCECQVILFEGFCISNESVITVDTEILKQVTSLKPTILLITRDYGYDDWRDVLQPGGNQKDADVLVKFAQENNIIGFELTDLGVNYNSFSDTFSPSIMQNLPAYLKQLKFSAEAIIGLRIYAQRPFIKNPCVTDFAALNDLVNYYEIYTYMLNMCEPELYNGMTPITAIEHGSEYQLGMEEVTGYLKETAVDYEKLYYTAEINPYDSAGVYAYYSYDQICSCSDGLSTFCIENTQNLFDKGCYVKKESCGINIRYVELDDASNTCGCGPFVAFHSILAGYTGSGSAEACPKIDQAISS